jgi:hypothetical protein
MRTFQQASDAWFSVSELPMANFMQAVRRKK